MKRILLIFTPLFAVFLFTGCGITQSRIAKIQVYPKMYEVHPKSILVLPAKNTTTAVDATDQFSYSITKPLAEKGYYVFPVHLVDSFFKSENISDAEIIRNIPVTKLKEIFNPDAILYVDINAWDTGYSVISSNVDVGLSFSLIDANTGKEIWQNNAYAYSYDALDTGNIVSLIVSAISTAINTGTDYTKLAYVANSTGVSFLPSGYYNEKYYKKDANDKFTYFNVATLEDGKLFVDEYFIFGNKKEGKVPLTIRGHAKGYHGLSVSNLNFYNHNGYSNYYITEEIKGVKYLRNRFFRYENNKPYLLVENKKVFATTEVNGKIPYSEENGKYYFQIDQIIEFEELETLEKVSAL
ncbi:MAG: DUF799 domain-containing protein [Arcobacter sp.]|uniref:DUF799 domain-containing protein n=1 Tax=Arcobacter sp. TaxID=1872629 RepID=UPI003B00DE0F